MSKTDISDILYVEENVLVAEFPPDMNVERERFAEVHEEFVSLVQRPTVDTHVTMLQMEDPMGSDVFEQGREGAKLGVQHGVTTWIAVSEDLKKKALRAKFDDIEGVTVKTTDTKEEAMKLAKQ
jgi:hypothetical protein